MASIYTKKIVNQNIWIGMDMVVERVCLCVYVCLRHGLHLYFRLKQIWIGGAVPYALYAHKISSLRVFIYLLLQYLLD